MFGTHGDLDGANGRAKFWMADTFLQANTPASIAAGGGVAIFIDVHCVAHVLNTITTKVSWQACGPTRCNHIAIQFQWIPCFPITARERFA